MSKQDFDKLVERAIQQMPGSSLMRPVVEKEILHYDIFKALNSEKLLDSLVFQGGTSLRLCRGSSRFSEDLDFVGGREFNVMQMSRIKECIEAHIGERYDLNVRVRPPQEQRANEKKQKVSVQSWMVTVETRPGNSALPTQKIKIEIANTVAYTKEPVPLKLNYDFLDFSETISVPTESLSEVLADKIVTFPCSLIDKNGNPAAAHSAKIRYRDIWDMSWLLRNGASLIPEFVNSKVNNDYGISRFDYLLENAIHRIQEIVSSKQFVDQMSRFIDAESVQKSVKDSVFVKQLEIDITSLLSNMQLHLM